MSSYSVVDIEGSALRSHLACPGVPWLKMATSQRLTDIRLLGQKDLCQEPILDLEYDVRP